LSHVDGVDDGVGYGVFGESSFGTGVRGQSNSGDAVLGLSDVGTAVFGRSNSGTALYGRSGSGYGVFGFSPYYDGVRGQSIKGSGVSGFSNGFVFGSGVYGFGQFCPGVHGDSENNVGVFGISKGSVGVRGESRYVGVLGRSSNGVGVSGKGNITGVSGWAEGAGVYGASMNGLGVLGESENGVGVNGFSHTGIGMEGNSNRHFGVSGVSKGFHGVWGESKRWDGAGVLGYSLQGGGIGVAGTNLVGGWAGYFEGDVYISGSTEISGLLSKIDHPLDPANKYLYHSYLESSDMKNLYDGVVTLDDKGEAEIELPEWFSALNKDFRYQLTAIGAPGPNLYIAEEISEGSTDYARGGNSKNNYNYFKIAGGTSGMKVSWQAIGVRNDPYAKAHPIQVEEGKSDKERGHYIHPEVYGQTEEKRISHLLFPTEKGIGPSHSPKQKREIPISD
jgi:hypothetical protein